MDRSSSGCSPLSPSFVDKEPKLVWRGKLSFAPKLRRALLDVARGTSWGDVKALDWRKKDNFLTMEDHCRYMFIGHVEGISVYPSPALHFAWQAG